MQANKAIVGRNAFAHEAGIHQDGMLKDRRTYEIMRPEDVGVPQTTLVLGKHSGRHARAAPLRAARRRRSTRLELDRVYRRMIALADAQKTVTDVELTEMVERAALRATPIRRPIPPSATRSTGATRSATDTGCRTVDGVRSAQWVERWCVQWPRVADAASACVRLTLCTAR